MRMPMRIEAETRYSVVVPVYNEEDVEPGVQRERRPEAVSAGSGLARHHVRVVARRLLERGSRAQRERRRNRHRGALHRRAARTLEQEVGEEDSEP